MLNTHKRYGRTNKKMISLTDDGREQIQRFAEAHGMSFSAAIESLALTGMNADLTHLLVPLLREVVNKALQRNFNRIAKLSLIGAAEGAMAHELASMLLMQFIRREAHEHADDFEMRLLVSYEPEDILDARIRHAFRDARKVARNRQQRALKTHLAELVTRLSELNDAPDEGENGHE
jgi:hypothetical protein